MTTPQTDSSSLKNIKPVTRVLIVGVGGAGCNILSSLDSAQLGGADLLAIDTDAGALSNVAVKNKFLLGRTTTYGLSTGGDPEVACKAADADAAALQKYFEKYHFVIINAGLGGGTGSGATPVIARIAAQLEKLVFAFVTQPFTFEGVNRLQIAQTSIIQLNKECNAVIGLPNDLLFQDLDHDAPALECFKKANIYFKGALEALTNFQNSESLIHLDFAHLTKAFCGFRGKTLFACGEAEGDGYEVKAIQKLAHNPFLAGLEAGTAFDSLIIHMVAGRDFSLRQMNELVASLTQKLGNSASTLLSVRIDENIKQSLSLSIIALTKTSVRASSKVFSGMFAQSQAAATQSTDASTSITASNAVTTQAPKPKHPLASLLAGKEKQIPQQEFNLVIDQTTRGFFENTEHHYFEGNDLDVPTYLRRGIKVAL